MTMPNERQEIAAIVGADGWYCGEHEHLPEMGECEDCDDSRLHTADSILASDWLAERDRRTAAGALREAAVVILRRTLIANDGAWDARRPTAREIHAEVLRDLADRIEKGA